LPNVKELLNRISNEADMFSPVRLCLWAVIAIISFAWLSNFSALAIAQDPIRVAPPAAVVIPAEAKPNRTANDPVEPLPISQQSPFTIPPGPATSGNDRNTFAGFPQFQDLSRLLPGNFQDTQYKWYGFVRIDGIYDFRPIAGTDSFVTSAIPVPQGRGQNSVLTPRYSRIGFDTETPVKELRDFWFFPVAIAFRLGRIRRLSCRAGFLFVHG
jgi:hypothetical protein